jgi:hypothetical protein
LVLTQLFDFGFDLVFDLVFDSGFALAFDFGFAPRFHAFWVPHSSPVLGRVGVLTSASTVRRFWF